MFAHVRAGVLLTVSVLLPVWNAAGTLDACLTSLARQTFTDWECVLVDDGSTDASHEVATRAARADTRIRVVRRPHGGIVDALTDGLRHCRGTFVARMDADDLMHRDRLRAQVDALARDTSLAAVGCHVRVWPRQEMTARLREYEDWLNGMRSAADVAREAFVECPVAHPTLMLRAEVVRHGYEDRGWPEDYDLVLGLLARGLRIGVVPKRLLSWRRSTGSLSRTDARYGVDRFTACKAHYLARTFLAERPDYVLWGYGDTGRALRRALLVHGKHPSHIVEVKRSRVGNRIHGAPVVAPGTLPGLAHGPIVSSVAHAGPRAVVRHTLAGLGFVEGRDFVCAA